FALFFLFLRLSIFTLFPYTTLFRSFAFLLQNLEFIYQKMHLPYFLFVLGGIILAMKITYTRKSISKSYTDTGERAKAINKFLVLDRKSTRLNSSHVKFSYAVFCLKK